MNAVGSMLDIHYTFIITLHAWIIIMWTTLY